MDQKLFRIFFSRPIAFHRIFAEITVSVTTGLFLSQLFYWHDKGSDPDGWIYKTYVDWKEETTMNRREIDMARKTLKSLKILEEKKEGVPAKLFYRIDMDALMEIVNGAIKPLSLDELLKTYDSQLLELSRTGLMRAKKTGIEAEFVDYRDLLKKKGATCGICNEPISMKPGHDAGCLVFDHIVPLHQGGSHTFANIQPAHAHCHAAKSVKDDPSPSLFNLSKQECLSEANRSAYLKQTNLYTENTTETTSSSDGDQGKDFEAIAAQNKSAYQEKRKSRKGWGAENQPNFYEDAPWGVLARKMGKEPQAVFEDFKTHVEGYAKKAGKTDPVKWAEKVIRDLFDIKHSEVNNSIWQEFEAIALGKVKPTEERVREKPKTFSAPPPPPPPSQATRDKLKAMRKNLP